MNKIIGFLGKYVAQPDKLLHFVGGAILGGLLTFLFGWVAGLLLGALIAWAKERYDKAHPTVHTWDGWDAFATFLGAALGAVLVAQLF